MQACLVCHPSFPHIRKIKAKHGLSTLAVAAIAYVEPRTVYLMASKGCLHVKDVDRILGSLSRVTGQVYSRETVGGYWVRFEEDVPGF